MEKETVSKKRKLLDGTTSTTDTDARFLLVVSEGDADSDKAAKLYLLRRSFLDEKIGGDTVQQILLKAEDEDGKERSPFEARQCLILNMVCSATHKESRESIEEDLAEMFPEKCPQQKVSYWEAVMALEKLKHGAVLPHVFAGVYFICTPH